LELRAARLHEPRLVLLAMELERERVAGADEQHLAAVDVRQRPDELVAPGLLDLPHLDRPRVERGDVRRVDAHVGRSSHASHSGCEPTWSQATRSSFGVFTVSQSPSCRCAWSVPSVASSGNVDDSWSPLSGKRAIASALRT